MAHDVVDLETILYLEYKANVRIERAIADRERGDGRQDRISYYRGQLKVLELLKDLVKHGISINTPAGERNDIKAKLGAN
jgi:hypothetical protein